MLAECYKSKKEEKEEIMKIEKTENFISTDVIGKEYQEKDRANEFEHEKGKVVKFSISTEQTL